MKKYKQERGSRLSAWPSQSPMFEPAKTGNTFSILCGKRMTAICI